MAVRRPETKARLERLGRPETPAFREFPATLEGKKAWAEAALPASFDATIEAFGTRARATLSRLAPGDPVPMWSEEFFALEVLRRIDALRAARATGDNEAALRASFELGQVLRDSSVWRPLAADLRALVGRQQEAARKATVARIEARGGDWRAKARSLDEHLKWDHPLPKDRNAVIAERLKLKTRTVADYLGKKSSR